MAAYGTSAEVGPKHFDIDIGKYSLKLFLREVSKRWSNHFRVD